MGIRRTSFRRLGLFVGLLYLVSLSPQARALTDDKLQELRTQGLAFEKKAEWAKACLVYEAILNYRRDLPGIRARYYHCLRRYYQARRHQDSSYQKEVLSLRMSQALQLYQFLVTQLQEEAIATSPLTPEQFYRKGVEELDFALSDPTFVRLHLPHTSRAKIQAFRASLATLGSGRPLRTVEEAANQVRRVALAAQGDIRLKLTVTVMEFACGAGYAIDDYTMYLTPAELQQLCDSLKGDGSLGLHLAMLGDRLVIAHVAPNSSAGEVHPPLAGSQLLAINGKSLAGVSVDTALEMLQGPAGTFVELLVLTPGQDSRTVTLRRRPVLGSSVEYQPLGDMPGTPAIGYIKITSFQETTPHELDEALVSLNKMGMKVLILDLRGNPGGLVPAAVEVARRFLSTGVIFSTQVTGAKGTTFQSRNPDALTLPLVVLVDGGTASAAEILAGALKENRRAKLVGQTTFGKGCIQELQRLIRKDGVTFPGGLRITVARFLSPSNLPFTGRGVTPHVVIERGPKPISLSELTDPQFRAALEEARNQADLMQ